MCARNALTAFICDLARFLLKSNNLYIHTKITRYMEKYEHFKTLAEKKRLTAEDKAEIKQIAKDMGIEFNTGCSNCYHDAVIQIALALKPINSEIPNDCEDGYVLHENIDITLDSYKFGRLHVCPKNCTPANAQLWLAAGIPLRFFKHVPNEGNE